MNLWELIVVTIVCTVLFLALDWVGEEEELDRVEYEWIDDPY